MRAKIVAANWKMNGDIALVGDMASALSDVCAELNEHAKCIICPPSLYLSTFKTFIGSSPIALGGQNCHFEAKGAFTGELSADMYCQSGASYMLVGHSERRALFHESDELVFRKFNAAKDASLKPILCVGETISERDAQETRQVIARQLDKVLDNVTLLRDAVIAYEPVWAIGTGKTATASEAEEIHAFIRELIGEKDKDIASRTPILYGGSVNETNAQGLFSMPNIDGGLVGGASLNVQQFVEIVKCINYC